MRDSDGKRNGGTESDDGAKEEHGANGENGEDGLGSPRLERETTDIAEPGISEMSSPLHHVDSSEMDSIANAARDAALHHVLSTDAIDSVQRATTDDYHPPRTPPSRLPLRSSPSAPAALASPDAEKESNLPDTSDVLEFEHKLMVEGTKSAANSDDLALSEKSAESIPTPLALEGGEHLMAPGAYRLSMSHPPQRVALDSAEYEGSSSLRASSGRSLSSPTVQRPETLLVEATLVEQDGNDEHGNTTSSHPGKPLVNAQTVRESRIPRGCWYLGLVVVIALAASAGAIVATQAGKRGNDTTMGDTAIGLPTLAPTRSPTQAPVVADPLEELLDTLPLFSTAALEDPVSPQSQALAWLAASPMLSTYSLERQRQLFAMVSLYYATAGPNWYDKANWLNPMVPECAWFSTFASVQDVCTIDGMLRHLAMSANMPNGTIPDEVALLHQLETLDLSHNGLMGKLPRSLSTMTTLRVLDLTDNLLGGLLPPELGALSELRRVRLGLQFNLRGPLPADAFSHWGQLIELNLSENFFDRGLPSALAQLSSLQVLDLSFNLLEGPLLAEIGQLTQLRVINLELNSFVGMIPSTWGNLTNLEVLSLDSNSLIGSVPVALCARAASSRLDMEVECASLDCTCGCRCEGASSEPPTRAPRTVSPNEATFGPTLLL
jgi:hypothetical protein